MSDSQRELSVACRLAREVGSEMRQALESARDVKVSHKGVSDIVTEVDMWSERLVTETIAREYPSHLVVGEETSASIAADRGCGLPQLVEQHTCWIVDPLDGTTNFSNRIPYCAFSIATTVAGVPMVGVVYDPFRDEMFTAVRGQGAFLNDRPIRVGEKDRLIDSVAATGFPNDRWQQWSHYHPTIEALVMSCRNVRSFGAAAIDLCWVACGRFDAMLEFNLKPWDVAAGSLIVTEAGGLGRSFGNTDGLEFSLFARAFAVSGARLFPAFIEAVSPTLLRDIVPSR